MEHHHHHTHSHERKTAIVVLLTGATMVVEIFYGIMSGSMALLADGIHMGSHVMAIGLSWLAYFLVRKMERNRRLKADSGKILSLSGYTSGILLLFFSLFIIIEAFERFQNPVSILFNEAIIVAIIGLIVNILSAVILHHKHDDSDINIRAAYLHVLADAVTSLSAIVGLLAAKYWDLGIIDPIAALVSSLVIIRWSYGLLKDSGKTLVDLKSDAI
ncbi:MAG: cation transporter [Bacteroidales bacterium]|nr:cation transporter [Bacteroidales bacterium]